MSKIMSRTPPMALLFSALLLAAIPNPSSSYRHVLGIDDGTMCRPSGFLTGKSGACNPAHQSECCKTGKHYPQYRCSPPTSAGGRPTPATMTINCFAENCDGGGPSECDGRYHSDSELVVALSTGWYAGGSRCHKKIKIHANGRSVLAKVVDECDSVNGCDKDHDFQPPCPNNIVDASPAVWKALGIHGPQVGELHITWSDV